MRTLAAVLWLCCGLAALDLQHGNPTAINGIIGAGICAVVVTACAALDRP